MAVKTLVLKKVLVKEGQNGEFVSLQNEDNNWYSYFGKNKLAEMVGVGGVLKVQYITKGKFKNVEKYKVIEKGEIYTFKDVKTDKSDETLKQEQIQKNVDAKKEGINRAVALKEASRFIGTFPENKKFVKGVTYTNIVLGLAEQYLKWLEGERELNPKDGSNDPVNSTPDEKITKEEDEDWDNEESVEKDSEEVEFDDDPFE